MHFSIPVVRIAALALSVGIAHAQTPPEYSPSTNNVVNVAFGNFTVSNGTYVLLGNTTASPALTLTNAQRNSSHVLAMIDLDAPYGVTSDNNTYSPLLHWMTFLSANTSQLPGGESSANDIAPYVGPQPSVGTGMHHYVTLLFSSPEAAFEMPVQFQGFNASNLEDRLAFNISGFAAEAGLTLSAANWFETQNTTAEVATTSGGNKVGLGLLEVSMALLGSICAIA